MRDSSHDVKQQSINQSQVEHDGWFMVFNATFNNISVISWR